VGLVRERGRGQSGRQTEVRPGIQARKMHPVSDFSLACICRQGSRLQYDCEVINDDVRVYSVGLMGFRRAPLMTNVLRANRPESLGG
jgi:hypothetical protein